MKIYVVFDDQSRNINIFESLDAANGFALDHLTFTDDDRFWSEANGGNFLPWGREMKLVLTLGGRYIFVREAEVVPSS